MISAQLQPQFGIASRYVAYTRPLAMKKQLDILQYVAEFEQMTTGYRIKDPEDLYFIKLQVVDWIYALNCLLFNKKF